MKRLKSIFATAILIALVYCPPAFGADPTATIESEDQVNPFEEKNSPDESQGYRCEKNLIEVMFEWDSKVRFRDGGLTDLAGNALAGVDEVLGYIKSYSWHRICSVPESKLDEMRMKGEVNKKASLYDLNNIYRLRIPDNLDIWEISRQLEALPGILLARPVPLPTPLPVPGPFQSQQNYEDPVSVAPPTGIDAEYAWTQTGGAGSGVTVCDLEYGWNFSHQDLPAGIPQVNPNAIYLPSGETDDHGTAVLGVMGSLNNGWGTTGICYNANFITCGTYYNDPGVGISWNVPGALAYAMSYLSAGDVIIIENQWDYLNAGTAHPDFIPIEWWLNYWPSGQSFNGVYAAIQNAVALGIHVIEAGGNGGYPTLVGIDTDALIWYPGGSGAIIVGAGGAYSGGTYSEGDLERVSFSSYGTRYYLQGWGENVLTTGYGYYYSSEGKNLWYTNSFAGTSSASPIVAGAVACCVGYWTGLGYSSSLLTPSALRDILKSTGTSQVIPPVGVIGPRPNLLAAFAQLKLEWVDDSKTPINISGGSVGHAWGDYDNDGDLDLYVGNSGTANYLFKNDGSGNFTDVSSSPINNSGNANGSAWADFDNDGYLDLYLAKSIQANQLFQGTGSPAFVDISAAPVNDAGNNAGTAWVDFDNDGLVDIYLVDNTGSNKLFKNGGGGSFTDVTAGPEGDALAGIGAAWGDYDNDGDLDIYICNYNYQPNKLIRNNGDGSFSDVTSGPLGVAGNNMCAVWGDYDNDEDLDIYLTGDINKLLRNDGGGTFTDVTSGPLADPSFTYGANWGDYDNDGDLDLYLANYGAGNKLLRNDGGTFVDATSGPIGPSASSIGASFADYDGDGDLDIYLSDYGGPNQLFKNMIGTNNHWFHIDLVGTVSNRSAIGARVKITTGAGNQIREVTSGNGLYGQNSLTVEFGLGSYTTVDQIEIKWPSGTVQTLYSYSANQKITIIEPSGSCDCTPGECNGIPPIDILDIVHLIDFKFKECPPGAGLGTCPPPTPYAVCSGDADCNCIMDILDIVLMIDWKFKECPPGAGLGTCPPPCSCVSWVAQCGTPIYK